MAHILPFPAAEARRPPADKAEGVASELVAMKHVNLETVVETVQFIRDIGRGHLLDCFNRWPTQKADRPAKPCPGKRKRKT